MTARLELPSSSRNPQPGNWSFESLKRHKQIDVEVGCFEKALFELKHPSARKFALMDYYGMQWYIVRFKDFRKTDSQHGRVWRLYRAKLLTATIKGEYDSVDL